MCAFELQAEYMNLTSFFRWQHQDHHHYQTASWNIKHFVILDFKAQLQLSEWLQRQPPCQGGLLFRRAVFQKLKFILVTYRSVWGKKGDIVFIVQLCRAGPASWGGCCSKHSKKTAAHTVLWERTVWSLCKIGSIHEHSQWRILHLLGWKCPQGWCHGCTCWRGLDTFLPLVHVSSSPCRSHGERQYQKDIN